MCVCVCHCTASLFVFYTFKLKYSNNTNRNNNKPRQLYAYGLTTRVIIIHFSTICTVYYTFLFTVYAPRNYFCVRQSIALRNFSVGLVFLSFTVIYCVLCPRIYRIIKPNSLVSWTIDTMDRAVTHYHNNDVRSLVNSVIDVEPNPIEMYWFYWKTKSINHVQTDNTRE